MASFVERTVDVIGADPNVPDSVFRELFSSVGDMYVVTISPFIRSWAAETHVAHRSELG